MTHTSVKLDTPAEFINITPINPLISKCEIKVCYVGEDPNRNKSVITKEVATNMANSLPGSPIVGFYNEEKQDFEGHNRELVVEDGMVSFKDTTRPYGFVPTDAKVWFQIFKDDGVVDREYLMTEGYLWTGQYPECQRIIDKGNNQSMELDEKTLDADWAKSDNSKPQFFIINEAIISKLCILGEDVEPCFEGATIQSIQFSFEDAFATEFNSMVKQLEDLIQGGGNKEMYTTFAVEIGDSLWNAIYDYIYEKTGRCVYSLVGVYEEETQKFAIVRNRETTQLYRLNFEISAEAGFLPKGDLELVEASFAPAYDDELISAFEKEFEKSKAEPGEEKCPECGHPISECTCAKEKEQNEEDKKTYALEDVVEYTELKAQFDELTTKFEALTASYNELNDSTNAELATLREFKASVEKAQKQAMIDKFTMLSDEDKLDVVENIDKYSVDEIEAKLCVICVHNRVSFADSDNDTTPATNPVNTFSLDGLEDNNDSTIPAWVKVLKRVANEEK